MVFSRPPALDSFARDAKAWHAAAASCVDAKLQRVFNCRCQAMTTMRAVVTGAGSGIGKAVAALLASRGTRVACVDVDINGARRTAESIGKGGHCFAALDVSDASAVNTYFEHGPFESNTAADILVNCAGITADSFMLKQTEDEFDRVVSVNLKGTYNVNQSFARAHVAAQNVSPGDRSPASIINVASIIGKVGNLGQTNYAASKAGVIGLTKSAAKELARYNIRVNALLPGFIETPMVESVPPKVKEGLVAMIPAGRLGRPEEIAEVAVFLASPAASYITGAAIEVTGGLHM